MIRADQATLEYSDQGRPVYACRRLSLSIGAGEYVGILGPSGSGKSSMLYLLSGLKIPTSGDVLYGDASLKSMPEDARSRLRRSEFGFVFQQPYLLGYLTALENVLVAATKGSSSTFAQELLSDLGISEKMHRRPHELSGGERQRVCVARALVSSPKVIFADEPTAALDHINGLGVVELLNRLRGPGSLVMVTHDPTMLSEADRVVTIEDGRVFEDPERGHGFKRD